MNNLDQTEITLFGSFKFFFIQVYDRFNFVLINYTSHFFYFSGHETDFKKKLWSDVDTLDLPYDYASIMHYGSLKGSIYKGLPAILPTKNSSALIGQRTRLSPMDIIGIRRYYKCEHYKSKSMVSSFLLDHSIKISLVIILLISCFCMICLCGIIRFCVQ
jgi:hypothetical protein